MQAAMSSSPHRDPFGTEGENARRQKPISSAEERAAIADPLARLRRDGYAFLHGLMPEGDVAALQRELDRINAATPWGRSDFEGRRTHRAYNLFGKTRAADAFALCRPIVALAEAYLEDQIQLSVGQGMTIYGGEQAQPLHRDDGHYGWTRPRPPLVLATVWALDDFTRANGGTRLLPGSHRAAGDAQPEGEIRTCEMPAGSVLVYDGSLWHGGGGASEPGARRRAIAISYARAWLRQQENQYLAMPVSEIRALPPLMQRLLGFWLYGVTLGGVDGEPPMRAIEEGRVRSGA
jgi:ectoine hydroxylase-related dioxygenase (phytanoyl-CoA dioxygenase family)